ncbi:GAF and ANTAR domain-containing protein [Streptomyces monomycini]|uniref:GAF and ANTAR domain-containing protein n=1 Tax=Streptomyces monomycini TaxID=371720 RepID=UPI00067B32DF|nr:GAF and ANTAR domain-containing protein [Streptomyces monomycini]
MTGPRPEAVALAARFAGQDHPARQLGHACRAALHETYSVGLTLAADAALAQRVSLCAAGPLAARGESLQINLGEGPCVQALSQGAPVRADDLDDPAMTAAWPVYARQARAFGIRAAFALPLIHGPRPGRQAGLVLTLYRDRPGPLPDTDQHTAQAHADAAELLLLTVPAPTEDDLAHAWLLPADAVVHQAIGMISYRHALSTGQALALLRAHAHSTETDLTTLAHAIVHDHLTLPDPPDTDPA